MGSTLPGFRLIRRKELDRLRAEVSAIREESQAQVADLTRKLRAAQDELAAPERTIRSRGDSSQAEQPTRDTAAPGQFPPGEAGAAGPPPVVQELVNMADQLVDLTGGGAPSDPQQASAALRWLGLRTQTLLAVCDVVRIEDSGPLDLQRHQVVACRAAPGDDLVDQIADTIRPGYAWHGSLLRPQQVIVYIPANEVTGS
jgi:hypothetical protein